MTSLLHRSNGGGKNTRLEIKVDGASGMDYVFLAKTLPFDRISAQLFFTNICIAVQRIDRARSMAMLTPPRMDMCAPRRMG